MSDPNAAPTTDISGFVQSIFTVKLTPNVGGLSDASGNLSNFRDVFAYNAQNDHPSVDGAPGVGSPGSPALDPVMTQIFSSIGSGSTALPAYFSKGKCRDTSIGGNDAINCYPQFNETDDVAEHPFLSTNPKDPLSGMGRVYSETYDDLQQIMYITFGVPQYNTLSNFYTGAIDTTLAKLMNNGSSAENIGELIGSAIGTFIKLPTLPLAFINRVLGSIGNTKITKYYEFKSTMPLYYRAANSMIIHLAVNLGLSHDAYLSDTSSATAGGSISSMSAGEQLAQAGQMNNGVQTRGLPDFFQDSGFDIYRILLKKYKYIENGFDISQKQTSDAALKAAGGVDVSADGSFAQNFITMFTAQLYDASLYIGFKVEKGVDSSESFTNETGPSSISQQVNQKAQAARETKFTLANGNVDGGLITKALSAIGGVVSGFAEAVGISSLDNVLAGAGDLDFPDIWKSSSFNKSYHFNMSLRSPYGDPYSILQNLYIPLALLLSGGLPRGIGAAAYTSPFVCRAYCKGMFAVPLGMISSMTIKRGADQFGWTTSRLPTCIDVSFEIKDLSPSMYLALGDGGTWEALKDVFGANSTFQEYLLTLSGMGLADRITWIRNLRRKASYLLGQFRSTKLSPFYWGATLGNSLPARMISMFLPATRLPNRN